jgi:hypothetical protein
MQKTIQTKRKQFLDFFHRGGSSPSHWLRGPGQLARWWSKDRQLGLTEPLAGGSHLSAWKERKRVGFYARGWGSNSRPALGGIRCTTTFGEEKVWPRVTDETEENSVQHRSEAEGNVDSDLVLVALRVGWDGVENEGSRARRLSPATLAGVVWIDGDAGSTAATREAIQEEIDRREGGGGARFHRGCCGEAAKLEVVRVAGEEAENSPVTVAARRCREGIRAVQSVFGSVKESLRKRRKRRFLESNCRVIQCSYQVSIFWRDQIVCL